MKVKKGSIHEREKCDVIVDLNAKKHQEKIEKYIKHGIPASDAKHGHHVKLQVKVHPIAADILEDLREKTGRKYWKNQSELLRSVLSVGSYITQEFLKKSGSLKREIVLLDLIHAVNRKKRESELALEVRKAIRELNKDPFDVDSKIKELQELIGVE